MISICSNGTDVRERLYTVREGIQKKGGIKKSKIKSARGSNFGLDWILPRQGLSWRNSTVVQVDRLTTFCGSVERSLSISGIATCLIMIYQLGRTLEFKDRGLVKAENRKGGTKLKLKSGCWYG